MTFKNFSRRPGKPGEGTFIGKGRGSANRKKTIVEKVRYQIISVEKEEEKITDEKNRFGWKAFATNSDIDKLSFHDAILSYRNEYRVERIFSRLKGRLNIAPLFVKKDDQIKGMTYLLTLCVRLLTLIEFVVQRSLKPLSNLQIEILHKLKLDTFIYMQLEN